MQYNNRLSIQMQRQQQCQQQQQQQQQQHRQQQRALDSICSGGVSRLTVLYSNKAGISEFAGEAFTKDTVGERRQLQLRTSAQSDCPADGGMNYK